MGAIDGSPPWQVDRTWVGLPFLGNGKSFEPPFLFTPHQAQPHYHRKRSAADVRCSRMAARPCTTPRREGRGRPATDRCGAGQGQRNSLSANRVVASSPGPSLAFCSSGGRSETLLGLRGGQTRGRRVSNSSGLCVVRFLKEETQPSSLFLEDSH